MTKKQTVIVDGPTARDQFASFMRGEQLFELTIRMEGLDGVTFDIPIIYEPMTAYQIAKIFEDAAPNNTPDEQFDYLADILNEAVRNWTFVNAPKGKADYANGEISVRDLTQDNRLLLERAIAPGVSKSTADIERELAKNRRRVGKGVRREPAQLAEPVT